MALTAAVTETTLQRLAYLLTRAGGAGTSLTIANATLQADAVDNGPLAALLAATYGSQALAQAALQGIGQGTANPNTTYRAHWEYYQVSGVIGNLVMAVNVSATLAVLGLACSDVDAVYYGALVGGFSPAM